MEISRHLMLVAVAMPGVLSAATGNLTFFPHPMPVEGQDQVMQVTLQAYAVSDYQLAVQDGLGIKVRNSIYRTRLLSDAVTLRLDFRIPREHQQLGMAEVTLWNLEDNHPLPYKGWIPMVIPRLPGMFATDDQLQRIAVVSNDSGTGPPGRSGKIEFIDLTSGVSLREIPISERHRVLTIGRDLKYAWVAINSDDGVARWNLDTGEVDQLIEIQHDTPFQELKAQVWGANNTILILHYAVPGRVETWAYLNGVRLPTPAPFPSGPPFTADDRGRILLDGGRACEISNTLGFTNCTTLMPGNFDRLLTTHRNWGISGRGIFDLMTGRQKLNMTIVAAAAMPERNQLLICITNRLLMLDGESLDELGVVSIGVQRASSIRWLAPDRVLLSLENSFLGGTIPSLVPTPQIVNKAILQAASGRLAALAPGSIVSIFGTGLGPDPGAGLLMESKNSLASNVENTEVHIDGIVAPLLYASDHQINAVVPAGLTSGVQAVLQASRFGIWSNKVLVRTATHDPALFAYPAQGRMYAAASNSGGQVQGPGTPLHRGDTAVFYATGLGIPPGLTASSVSPRAVPLAVQPSLTIGGKAAQILYAGAAPGLSVGVTQINVVVPSDAPEGQAVEVALTIGGQIAKDTWVSIR
jgi:uncharacterized protein (TIGR03437 family)